MMPRGSLRTQLALSYSVVLLVALVAFAAVTLAVVDRTQRAALDERLQTATLAIGAVADVRHGRVVLDPEDVRLRRIVGEALDAAVFSGPQLVAATEDDIPAGVLRAARNDEVGRLTTLQYADRRLRLALAPVRRDGAVLGAIAVWRETEEIVDLDRRLAILFALAIPAVAAFALAGGRAIARRGLRPLDDLAVVASEIEAHDLSRRIDIPPRDDELGRLCATFDRMLDRLESAFARERRFTGDASHELRAPLSVIRAEADLTLRRPRSAEEYQRALRSIAAQADELEAVTRDLLAAARGEIAPNKDAVADLSAVARDTVARLQPLAQARSTELSACATATLWVRGDPTSLRRAALCLVDNALAYGRGGQVEVSVDARDGVGRIVVEDDGPGFSSEALEHATERFWRDDPARSRGHAGGGGTGLGLAIVAAIARATGGSLTLSNRPGGGASAVLEVPRAVGPFTVQ